MTRLDSGAVDELPATSSSPLALLESAASLVHSVMPPTPQYCWPLLCQRTGTEVWTKHENYTPAGAFKVRGGLVFVDELVRREGNNVPGLISATRGNHGQSLGMAAKRFALPVVIVVPRGNSPEKNAAMRSLGVELIEYGDDFQAASEHATGLAEQRGFFRVPAFHPTLVRGVATYALEFFRAAPALETVYIPIGMGSGICGAVAARDALGLSTRIVGVVSAGAPAYALSFAAGKLISHPVTTRIADGMACRQPDPLALESIGKGVDRIVEVTDDEIEAAMRFYFTDIHNVVEGAGAAGLAALMKEKDCMRGRRVGLVVSGGNVDREVFARVLKG